MSNTFIEYTGSKKKGITVPFPCPLTSLSEQEGEVHFPRKTPVELRREWADQLLAQSPVVFREVEPMKPEIGKRTAGKFKVKESGNGEGVQDSSRQDTEPTVDN